MALSPGLRAAYEKADYVVLFEPELVFHVGEASLGLDEVMAADGAFTAAFITADNPVGMVQDEQANLIAYLALSEALEPLGYATYRGEGRDPSGEWRAEASVLVVGIPREEAIDLGERMRQNAIVFIEKGRAPELVVLA